LLISPTHVESQASSLLLGICSEYRVLYPESGKTPGTEILMTRITSFGRKRTYVEAGFGQADAEPGTSIPTVSSEVQEEHHMNTPLGSNEAVESAPPKKKKRIRTPKHKRDNYVPPTSAEDTETATAKDGADEKVLSNTKLRKKEKTKIWREKSKRNTSLRPITTLNPT
jgi:hypothetical protein